MRRYRWLVMLVIVGLLSAACGAAGGDQVPFYELVNHPGRYDQQDITVLGFYYQQDLDRLLVVGVRTDDGFQNPVPLGEPIWVEGMPEAVLEQLNFASGVTYGMVEVSGRFETGGRFGPAGQVPSRLVIADPAQVVALEATQMEEAWVPGDLGVPDAVPLTELVAHPGRYQDQIVVTVAYYYWTPQTWVLAEGVRTLDGVHNAVPIGEQVWVEGFPPEVSEDLNVIRSGDTLENVHGLVKVSGRFETRGGYGPNQAYPYRLVVRSAEAIPP